MEFAGTRPKLFALIFAARTCIIGFAAAALTPDTFFLPAALLHFECDESKRSSYSPELSTLYWVHQESS